MAAPLCAGPLTQGERDRALSELHASRKQFLDALEGVSTAQWTFKPDDRTWSVAECAEHIALTEDFLLGILSKQVMAGPADSGRKPALTDETILKVITDRSVKAQAPEPIQPKRQFASREALVAHFKESRERTLDYVRDTQDDLRSHFFKHPAVGDMDAYQMLLLISAHTERHTAQIKEVKSNAAFPKP